MQASETLGTTFPITRYFETALFVVNQTLCYLDVMTKLIGTPCVAELQLAG